VERAKFVAFQQTVRYLERQASLQEWLKTTSSHVFSLQNNFPKHSLVILCPIAVKFENFLAFNKI